MRKIKDMHYICMLERVPFNKEKSKPVGCFVDSLEAFVFKRVNTVKIHVMQI